jgi:hypothetical protein
LGHTLLDDALEQAIVDACETERDRWLILEADDRFLGHWEVQGFGSDFRFDLAGVIGPMRLVSPASLEAFLDACDEFGYAVAFADDPEAILEPYRRLSEPPRVQLTSSLPGTVNGLLPFQARGMNFLCDQPRAGVAQWSTGCGKAVLQTALLKYHQDSYGLCWSLVKAHNKINAQRTYLRFAGVEAILLEGTLSQREASYLDLLERLNAGERGLVVVSNYEKFRDDFCSFKRSKSGEWLARLRPEFAPFFEIDSLYLWDEMPTKLKSRASKLYKGVIACLYNSPYPSWEKRRASWLRQYMFSATPIENDPEDFFNCVRLMDPDVYGTVKDFRAKHVKRYSHFDPNKPEKWHRLDEMQLAAAHIVHQADKERDPEIRRQFPASLPDLRVLDWSDEHWASYKRLIDLAEQAADEAEEEGETVNLLALITVLQMYCDLPSMVSHSGALREAWEAAVEDAGPNTPVPPLEGSKVAQRLLGLLGGKLPKDADHSKLLELKTILLDEYPDDKILIFSRFSKSFLPSMSRSLEEWEVKHVVYGGTPRQLQEAEDSFKSDPSVRVFLSSDRGSDSINLQEARIGINYDLPLLWSRKVQRDNRKNRVTSAFSHTIDIDLVMADSVELRILEIIERKKSYHDALFGGVIADQSISASTTSADLRYILRGA